MPSNTLCTRVVLVVDYVNKNFSTFWISVGKWIILRFLRPHQILLYLGCLMKTCNSLCNCKKSYFGHFLFVFFFIFKNDLTYCMWHYYVKFACVVKVVSVVCRSKDVPDLWSKNGLTVRLLPGQLVKSVAPYAHSRSRTLQKCGTSHAQQGTPSQMHTCGFPNRLNYSI